MNNLAWMAACLVSLMLVFVCDFLHRRIPNALCGWVALMGCSYWLLSLGTNGLLFAGQGALVGGLLLWIFYLGGFLGAGDVKICAAFGTWLGPYVILWAIIYGCLVVGMLSIATITHVMPNGYWSIDWQRAHSHHQKTVPLAAALAIGVVLAVLR